MVWDDWPPSTSPLLTEFSSREDNTWSLSGRRAEILGTGRSGVGQIRVRPWSVVREVRLEVNGVAPVQLSLKVAPDEVVRVLSAGEVQLTERITTALDHPLIFWSIVADAPVSIRLSWLTDLDNEDSAGISLIQMVAEEPPPTESHLRVGREERAPRFQVQPIAGIAGITGISADSLGFEVRSDRILRVVLAAGADDAELDRAMDALRRRKLRAFRQDRILHSRRIEDRLVSLVSPDASFDRAFGWAKVRLDGMLEARPHAGRHVARNAVRVAQATLAMGDRDLARDVLRSLRLSQGDPRRELPQLVDWYTRWTGEMLPDEASPSGGANAELPFDLTALQRDPAETVLGVIEGIWGIRPDAIRGELRLMPALPRQWNEMTLQRLRVGATTLDLRLRRRAERTVIAVRRSAGPPLKLRLGLRDRVGHGPVTVDEVELSGPEIVFTTGEENEVTFHDE